MVSNELIDGLFITAMDRIDYSGLNGLNGLNKGILFNFIWTFIK